MRHAVQFKDAGALGHAMSNLCEVKLAGTEGDAAHTFSGYGAVFGNVDSYGDVIAKGAFADTLARAKSSGEWPAMLLQHGGGFLGGAEDQTPIGVWLSMKEDDKGLFVEGKLADTQRGRDVYSLLKMTPRPAITGLSIGYVAKEWSVRTQPEEPRRTLKKVELIEVSLVTNPANRQARVSGVKSDSELIREFEQLAMRGAGMSRSDVRKHLLPGFKSYLATLDAGGGGSRQMLDSLEGLAEQLTKLTSN